MPVEALAAFQRYGSRGQRGARTVPGVPRATRAATDRATEGDGQVLFRRIESPRSRVAVLMRGLRVSLFMSVFMFVLCSTAGSAFALFAGFAANGEGTFSTSGTGPITVESSGTALGDTVGLTAAADTISGPFSGSMTFATEPPACPGVTTVTNGQLALKDSGHSDELVQSFSGQACNEVVSGARRWSVTGIWNVTGGTGRFAGTSGAGSLLWFFDFPSSGAKPAALKETGLLDLPKHPTTTGVKCEPNPVVGGKPTTCTATVTDTAASGQITPKGTVSFESSEVGSFSPEAKCELNSPSGASNSCSVTYTPIATPEKPERSETITATYGGDEIHEGSKGTTAEAVTPPPATCGKTTVGKSAAQLLANIKRVNRCALPFNALVSKLTVYLQPTLHSGSQMIKGILYEDSKGKPTKRVGVTEQLTFKSTNLPGWYDLVFRAPLKLIAGNYWIGTITGATANVGAERFDSVSNAQDVNNNNYTAGPSDPFGSFKVNSEEVSLYATFTAA
jgi:hypothetical protein